MNFCQFDLEEGNFETHCGGDSTEKCPPHCLWREVIGYFLQAEQDSTDGRGEGNCHPCRRRGTQYLTSFTFISTSKGLTTIIKVILVKESAADISYTTCNMHERTCINEIKGKYLLFLAIDRWRHLMSVQRL